MELKSKLATVGGVILMLVVAGVARVGGRAATEAGIHAYQQHEAVGEIDRIENSAGPFEDFFKELAKVDPVRFEAMKAGMKNAIASGASAEDVSARMQEYGREMLADYRRAAPRASDAELREVARNRLAVLKLAQSESVDDCARLASTGVWPGMTYGPGMKEALGAAAASIVRAGHEGMISPITRGEPPDAEYKLFGKELVDAGLTPNEMRALGANDLKSLSSAQQCNLIVTVFDQAVRDDSPRMLAQLIQD